ncbi:MAG: recombinase family protein, partial [Chloroflexota bacterium]|nr:recombinase family protein [Chloroflexota bacterium]
MRSRSNAQMRAALYFRVSSEEQVEGYSLDAQARAARAWCEAHDWQVAAEYRDEGKSARTEDITKRPAFVQMIDDAESRQFDVIVVHKLDRFARNLRVTLETLDRLSSCDVTFVSISENMDFTTPIGRVLLSMLGAFAQYYSDNLSWETKKGKHERKRQGMYNGHLPFGTMKGDDGIAIADPDTLPGIVLAFDAAAAGRSDRDVAAILNTAGYRTNGNRGANPFTKDTARRILTNRFYLGELPEGDGGWMQGKHEAMIDADLFDAAQRMRTMNRTNQVSVRTGARVHALTSMCVCGGCGSKMHVWPDSTGKTRLTCYGRSQGNGCRQRSLFASLIEEQVAEYLSTFHIPSDYQEQVMALYREANTRRGDAAGRRREIDGQLDRLKTLFRL